MSEHKQNQGNASKTGASHAARKLTCEEWEALLVDLLDGALPENEAESFQAHQLTCASCAEIFQQAGKGREWLNFLRVEPPVSPVLVSRILAQTSGTVASASPVSGALVSAAAQLPIAAVAPFWKRPAMLMAAHRAVEPRMLMTAAMAFFSITLSLNIAGVRLGAVRLADLKPTALSSNLNKQYHMASARVVRYYDNLRFVYEMEARVKELRHDADLESAPADKQDQPVPAPIDGDHKSGGKSQGPGGAPHAMLWGDRVVASLRIPTDVSGKADSLNQTGADRLGENQPKTAPYSADQAERGNA